MLRFAVALLVIRVLGSAEAQAVELTETVLMMNGDGMGMSVNDFYGCIKKDAPVGADITLEIYGDTAEIAIFSGESAVNISLERIDDYSTALVSVTVGPIDDEENQVRQDVEEFFDDFWVGCQTPQ